MDPKGMDIFHRLTEGGGGGGDGDGDHSYWEAMGIGSARQTNIQILLSLALGVSAFLAFCVLRPRWTGLYAARKKTKNEATGLPELPTSLFGWIVPLYKITDQQLLASAGLDAYVFLAFFKMAIKFLTITFFFSLVVIKPVHDAFPEQSPDDGNKTTHHNHTKPDDAMWRPVYLSEALKGNDTGNGTWPPFLADWATEYLWMYVVFAYLFSAIAIYLIVSETRRIIEVRQEYLGTQTTVTDRTIRLSGIPFYLQDEGKIKDFIESLDIGEVESVSLCRDWKELDKAMVVRMDTLRRLEEAYTIYQRNKPVGRNGGTIPNVQISPPESEGGLEAVDGDVAERAQLLASGGVPQVPHAQGRPITPGRPTTTIRFGRFNLRSKRVDAIDFYEEKLRQLDDQVRALRQKEFPPTRLAFVTMDSVAACQMAIQAVLDPSPLQLIASQSPAPSDVIWPNTYITRRSRMIRAWTITALIVFLTVFWSVLFVPIAALLSTETIGKVFPQVGDFLEHHDNIRSLLTAQLPTLIASLLNVLVPYLYYWLSWYQGMASQGDVELSAISKNFFFTFFNFFVVFMFLGTASKFYDLFEKFGEALTDFRMIAHTLALSLRGTLWFYVNFIILQGVGLFPFRLLEIGSVSLYPIYRIGAKTPRDYAELVQPPVFSYGFYLPNALLIFIICMVYSVLRWSWAVLLAGLIYFFLGYFTYKYQLLYAMDHQQHSTGRAWGMICDRIFVGMVFFQLTTAGQLLLMKAVARSVLMGPLIVATVSISILFGRTYKPLMKFIALQSVRRGEEYRDDPPSAIFSPDTMSLMSSSEFAPERNVWADRDGVRLRYQQETRRRRNGQSVDEVFQSGLRFINPSLVAPLAPAWIADVNSQEEAMSSPRQDGEV